MGTEAGNVERSWVGRVVGSGQGNDKAWPRGTALNTDQREVIIGGCVQDSTWDQLDLRDN